MPISVLRPNGTVSNDGWAITGTSAHAATSDTSDSTYVEVGALASKHHLITLDWANVVLPAGAKIRQVRQRWRRQRTANTGDTSGSNLPWMGVIHVLGASEVSYSDKPPATAQATPTEHSSPWLVEKPGGGEWLATNVDALRVRLSTSTFDFPAYIRVHELWLDVDYNERPAVAPSILEASAGVVSNTTAPTVVLGYSDPEGDAQQAYHVQVYTDAGGGALGDLVWDSGEVSSTATQVKVGVDLDNGSYVARVRARQVWDGPTAHWSTWQTVAWTQDVPLTNTPTLTVTADADSARVLLEVADGDGANPAEWFTVERLDADGWRIVRNAEEITASIYDYEAANDVETAWRARGYRLVTGTAIASEHSATKRATVATNQRWLKDPLDPTRNRIIRAFDPSADIEGREAVFRGLGDVPAIVVADTPGGQDDQLRIHTHGEAEHAAVLDLLTRPATLLLQSVRDHRYVHVVGNRPWTQVGHDGARRRIFTVTFVEVGRP